MKRQNLAIAFVIFFATVAITFAQARPAFEAASVKQADTTLPGNIRGISCHGVEGAQGHPLMQAGLGRCRLIGLSLKAMISVAYAIASDRVIGGPAWAESLPYTVEAKAEDPPTHTRAQLYQMIQALLEDRFQLKFHRETRMIDGYVLVAGKDGLKLKASSPELKGQSTSEPRIGEVSGRGTMSSIASFLSRRVGAPVTDSTGIAGIYDFTLKWTPEASIDPGAADGADRSGPSIFTAVQEQLGLRLEPKKTSIEVIVVDSAEKAREGQ